MSSGNIATKTNRVARGARALSRPLHPASRLVVVLCLPVFCSCASDHHVSPWVNPSALLSLAGPSDLDSSVRKVMRRMNAQGLNLVWKADGHFVSHNRFRLMEFRGRGPLGTIRSAIRLTTRFGTVLALGPSEAGTKSVSLMHAIGEGRRWRSGTDINGDATVDVVVRTGDGCLHIWSVHAHGSSPYPSDTGRCAVRATDLNDDGRPELVAQVSAVDSGTGFPVWDEFLALCDGEYSAGCDSVPALHASAAAKALRRREKLGPTSGRKTVGAYLGLTLLWAWHALRAGQDVAQVRPRVEGVVARRAPYDPEQQLQWTRATSWLWKMFPPSEKHEDTSQPVAR